MSCDVLQGRLDARSLGSHPRMHARPPFCRSGAAVVPEPKRWREFARPVAADHIRALDRTVNATVSCHTITVRLRFTRSHRLGEHAKSPLAHLFTGSIPTALEICVRLENPTGWRRRRRRRRRRYMYWHSHFRLCGVHKRKCWGKECAFRVCVRGLVLIDETHHSS